MKERMTTEGETMYENKMGQRSTDQADKFAAIRPWRSGRELPKVINPATVTQAT